MAETSVLENKVEVNPQAVLSAIEKTRRHAANVAAKEADKGKLLAEVRSTLANVILIISSGSKSELDNKYDELISHLCVAFPSRFFIVEFDAVGNSPLRAAVSSRRVKSNSGIEICSEEVYVRVGASQSGVIKNFLLGLLVPDVDICTVLLCDPMVLTNSSAMLSGLTEISDTFIFDSSIWKSCSDSGAVISELEKRILIKKNSPVFRDLAWSRIKKWRTAVAEQFESERVLRAVPRISNISFVYAGSNLKGADLAMPSEALLMAGWFLKSLGWQPQAICSRSTIELGIECFRQDGMTAKLNFSILKEVSEEKSVNNGLVEIDIIFDAHEHDPMRLRFQRLFKKSMLEISNESCGDDVTCEIFMRRVPFNSLGTKEVIVINLGAHEEDKQHALAAEGMRELLACIR